MRREGIEVRTWSATALVVAALVATASAAWAQGVRVALMPASQTVSPGAEFDLEIDVTEPGSPFNAYDAVLAFDPQALTFLPMSPLDLQEGSYMTGACGETFHRFAYAADTLVISHALLCNGLALTGPGQLYRLHFRASATAQMTAVRFRRVQFYNGGLYVNPAHTADATINIGSVSSVEPTPGGTAGTDFALGPPWPNPTAGPVRADFVVGRQAAVRIGLWDTQGRRVAWLASGTYPPGRYRVSWDGRSAGARLAAGIYFLRMEASGRALVRPLALRP